MMATMPVSRVPLTGRQAERPWSGRLSGEQLLAEGLDDAAIAERLYVSPKTVRNQMVNLLAKLGVDSRLQALVLAARHRIVTIR